MSNYNPLTAVVETNMVEWVPLNLLACPDVLVRRNDALMFTVQPLTNGIGSATVSLDDSAFGAPVPLAFGGTNIHRFAQAGVYTLRADWTNAIGSNVVSKTRVTVIGGSFARDPLLTLNSSTYWTNTLPAEAWLDCDANLRLDRNPDSARLSVTLTSPETAYVAARLGEGGPVLATARVDELGFASHTQSGYMDYFRTLPDGTEVFEGRLSLKNIRPGLTVRLTAFATGNYFEGGLIVNGRGVVEFDASDFDENGELRFLMYMAEGTQYYCHTIELFLDGVPLNL